MLRNMAAPVDVKKIISVVIGISMNHKEKYKALKPLLDEIKKHPEDMHINIHINAKSESASSHTLTIQHATRRISMLFEEYQKPAMATVCYSYCDASMRSRDKTSTFTDTANCDFQDILLFIYIYNKTKGIIAESPYANEIKRIYRKAIRNGITKNIEKLRNRVK